ncbi:uncharacterized protein [Bemisia tabaci]|uniref:uncharacterized protein n=1 Tax=Bemisia tabaci TaxID=7038 RepID=UPI003B28A3F2
MMYHPVYTGGSLCVLCLLLLGVSGARRGLFRSARFEQGDRVLNSVIPIPFLPLPPSHVMFALSSTELLHVERTSFSWSDTIPTIIHREMASCTQMLKYAKVLPPRPTEGRPVVAEKGAIIARRLHNRMLPYHITRCNCNHYADYLVYGRTFGRKKKLWYQPMNASCPLYTRIHANTEAETVVLTNRAGVDQGVPPYTSPPLH